MRPLALFGRICRSVRARSSVFSGSGAEYDGSYQTVQNMQIGFAPGMTAFITDWSAVEVSVGVMGFDFKWIDQETNKVEEGRQRVSSGNFKINLFSINIGMTFYL